MIAAESEQHPVLQRHRVLLQAQAIDEGAVGTLEILDAGAAVLLENVRMAPRQETELPAVLVLVARKRRVALADEERKAGDDDRLKVAAGGRGRQRQAEAFCRAPGGAGAWRDLHAVREHATEADFVAVVQPAGSLRDGGAVDGRPVPAVQVGEVDDTLLAEDPSVPARQHLENVVLVGREGLLGSTDGEHAPGDAYLAQLRPRQGLEHNVEVVMGRLHATDPFFFARQARRGLLSCLHPQP
jgi:hypothetical protein